MAQDESNEQRVQLARNLAIEEGRRRERVDGQLQSHELRLNKINGSIDRQNLLTSELRTSFEKLREEVRTKNAVEAALHEEIRDANDKQISTRQFMLGVLSILAMILAGTIGPHLFG